MTPYTTIKQICALIKNYRKENVTILVKCIPGFGRDDIAILASMELKMTSKQASISAINSGSKTNDRSLFDLTTKYHKNAVHCRPSRGCKVWMYFGPAAASKQCKERKNLNPGVIWKVGDCPGERAKETMEPPRPDDLRNCENPTVPSLTASVLYSFDYVQQVHIPSDQIPFKPQQNVSFWGNARGNAPASTLQLTGECKGDKTRQLQLERVPK